MPSPVHPAAPVLEVQAPNLEVLLPSLQIIDADPEISGAKLEIPLLNRSAHAAKPRNAQCTMPSVQFASKDKLPGAGNIVRGGVEEG